MDCGWDERFDLAYIDAIKMRIPQINAILISYGDVPHLGALPYLVGKCGLNCPVYATVSCGCSTIFMEMCRYLSSFQVPVYKMGQLFLYDWVNGHNNVEDFSLFNFDDVDMAFEKVQQVKYSQTVSFNASVETNNFKSDFLLFLYLKGFDVNGSFLAFFFVLFYFINFIFIIM